MKQVILFDGSLRDQLLPLCFLRPVAALRIGIDTIAEKWARQFRVAPSYLTQDFLADIYPMHVSEDNLLINGGYLPSPPLLALLRGLEMGDALLHGEELIAARLTAKQMKSLVNDQDFGELTGMEVGNEVEFLRIGRPYDLFRLNDQVLREDFVNLFGEKNSQDLPASNRLIGPKDQLFIDLGARIEGASFNTTTGPIYIGPGVQIMEGSLLRGPLAIGANSVVKMGTKIYGASSFGPHCRVGGEVNNVIFQSHSSKGHDGYLGNSVIGSWCNFGAGSSCSNLKNTYGEVKVWNYGSREKQGSGLQFCGLIMGDHSKAGINSMFNTGTVIGTCCNVYGGDYPPTFIPDFSWGGSGGLTNYDLEKAFENIQRVMERRNQEFSVFERLALLRVFEETKALRS